MGRPFTQGVDALSVQTPVENKLIPAIGNLKRRLPGLLAKTSSEAAPRGRLSRHDPPPQYQNASLRGSPPASDRTSLTSRWIASGTPRRARSPPASTEWSALEPARPACPSRLSAEATPEREPSQKTTRRTRRRYNPGARGFIDFTGGRSNEGGFGRDA